MITYRYSRWDGSQEPFPLHEDDLMEQLSDQLMAQGDVSAALRSLVQRGASGRSGQRLSGIQDILQHLRALSQQTLERYDLNSIVAGINERLQDIIYTEREGIQHRLEDVASRLESPGADVPRETGEELLRMLEHQAHQSRELLDQLPSDSAARLRQLSEYEFMDPEARAKFDERVRSLQQRMLDSHGQELSQRLHSADSLDVEGLKEMLRDLNRMLEQRLQGAPPSDVGAEAEVDFQAFMQRHGRFFGPEPPANLDELIERMQHQIAQMQDLLRNMSPDQRQELQELLDAALQDPELREEMGWLADNLDALSQRDAVGHNYPFQGNDSLTLEEAPSADRRDGEAARPHPARLQH